MIGSLTVSPWPWHTFQGLFVAIHGVVRGSIGHEFLFDGPHDGMIAEVELVLARTADIRSRLRCRRVFLPCQVIQFSEKK